jgi:probable rRNA maturation factor
MVCGVTFHDRLGADRLAGAVDPLDTGRLHELLEAAIDETIRAATGSDEVEIELTLCGDTEMTRLNFDHMGERGPTDVLSFPLHEWEIDQGHSRMLDDDGTSPPGALLLGDVAIDVDQAVRQAAGGGWSVAEEIVLLAIHGSLHLVGHDHADMEEEQAMRRIEHHVLGVLHRKHHEIAWQPGSLFDRAGHAISAGS